MNIGRRNNPRQQSRHGSLAARKIRGRPRHGNELCSGVRDKRRLPLQISQARHVSQTHFPTQHDTPRSSEPILIPKLWIQFADFPYLLINQSTRGCLPWKPAADMGTNWRDTCTFPSPGISRSEGKIRTTPQLHCSSGSKPNLPAIVFQGTRTLTQKRKLFPDVPTASPGHFGLPRPTLLRGPEWYAIPLPGSGIGTGFPFARQVLSVWSIIIF